MDPPADSHSPEIVAIIRQHAHDVRNHINSLDLEAAMLGEGLTDDTTAGALVRIRRQIAQVEAAVSTLCVKFLEPQPMDVPVLDLVYLWKNQIQSLPSPPRVDWAVNAGRQIVTVDLNALLVVLRELVISAATSCLEAAVFVAVTCDTEFVIEIRHAARPPEANQPSHAEATFSREERQRLGLDWVVKRNGGRLLYEPRTESGDSLTTLRFPLSAP
jgi:hypothetical protein